MEITKGYTLSQFIDECNIIAQMNEMLHAPAFRKIKSFNDLCKKELSIDQFINQVPKPNNYNANQNPLSVDESKEWKEYLESEKKVIFKGWNKSALENEVYHEFNTDLLISIEFRNDGILFYHNSLSARLKSLYIKTIGDLFRITNGELELQNVDL